MNATACALAVVPSRLYAAMCAALSLCLLYTIVWLYGNSHFFLASVASAAFAGLAIAHIGPQVSHVEVRPDGALQITLERNQNFAKLRGLLQPKAWLPTVSPAIVTENYLVSAPYDAVLYSWLVILRFRIPGTARRAVVIWPDSVPPGMLRALIVSIKATNRPKKYRRATNFDEIDQKN